MWISQGQRTQGGVKRECYLELLFEANFFTFYHGIHHHFSTTIWGISGIFSFIFSKHQIFANLSQESNLWQDIPSSVPWYGKISCKPLIKPDSLTGVLATGLHTCGGAWLWNSHRNERWFPHMKWYKIWAVGKSPTNGRSWKNIRTWKNGGWETILSFQEGLFPGAMLVLREGGNEAVWPILLQICFLIRSNRFDVWKPAQFTTKMVLSDGWHLFCSQFQRHFLPTRDHLVENVWEKKWSSSRNRCLPWVPYNAWQRQRTDVMPNLPFLAIFKRAL